MPPFLAHQSWSSFDDKTLLADTEAILTHCECAVFLILKP